MSNIVVNEVESENKLNKSKIKNFAINARKWLMEAVTNKAYEVGITPDGKQAEIIESSDGIVINGRIFNNEVKNQRARLVQKISDTSYEHVIDEVAYIWFNRFIALRFLEVNKYLEHDLNILSSQTPVAIAPRAINYFDKLNQEEIRDLALNNKDEELYKKLIIAQFNALNTNLPFLFEKINDYTELLFPAGLLSRSDSPIKEMLDIPEKDWQEVEIVGWLYQYYIIEEKNRIYAALNKGKRIKKEDIPAATQIFTPKYIVKYMVENSLGRLWLETNPNDELKSKWKYYVEPLEQEFEVKRQIETIRNGHKNPEAIKILDPCCGSGHILVYAFDILYDIYKQTGYVESDIPKLILEKNLFGLDICDRAVQLACFAVSMKAREYDSRILLPDNELKLNIYAFKETSFITEHIEKNKESGIKLNELFLRDEADQDYANRQISQLRELFEDAKNYGSSVKLHFAKSNEPIKLDLDFWNRKLIQLNEVHPDLFSTELFNKTQEILPVLVKLIELVTTKYEIVITNPPYMAVNKLNLELEGFIKKNYPNSKADLFSVFIEKNLDYVKDNYFIAMVTQHSWMFLSSYKELRSIIMNNTTIDSMMHLGARAFEEVGGEVVQTTSFVMKKNHIKDYKGQYFRLTDYNTAEEKEFAFLKRENKYIAKEKDFESIPESPIIYWATNRVKDIFNQSKSFSDITPPKAGLSTGNNPVFQRYWHEVNLLHIGLNYSSIESTKDKKHTWFPCNSGGEFRKWYGNNDIVVNFLNNGENLRNYKGSVIRNSECYFKKGLTWNKISSKNFGARYKANGFIFDDTGRSAFPDLTEIEFVLANLCSKVAFNFLKMLNPTLSFTNGDIERLPLIYPKNEDILFKIKNLAGENITISKINWDSFEISWDFAKHPFILHKNSSERIEDTYKNWETFTNEQFDKLKVNEEELNRIFIDIYGLQDELTPEVEDKDVTIRKAELERDVKSFISYAIGCMMGRYSLDEAGLAYAGGEFDKNKYKTFSVDEDAILPVLDDCWFEDDIVSRFKEFLKVTFGESHLNENLEFIANTLYKTGKESAEEKIRKYFLNDFYKDHLKTYNKRPIYWMVSSGKEKGFNCLIYLHRYHKDTVARIRKDYLHELQSKIDREIEHLEEANEKKKLDKLKKQQLELIKFDETLKEYADKQIELDLDDGVKVNYAKLGKLLVEVK